MNILFLLLLSLTGFTSQSTPTQQQTTNQEIKSRYFLRVTARSAQDMTRYTQFLQKNGFDIAGTNWKEGIIEVITTPSGVNRLAQLGLPGFQRSTPSNFKESFDSRYLNPSKVETKLKELNQKFPQFTRLEKIGTSVLGRPIWALLVSSTPNLRSSQHNSKPSILFDGLHHAREIMTPEVVLDVGVSVLNTLSRGNQRIGRIKPELFNLSI